MTKAFLIASGICLAALANNAGAAHAKTMTECAAQWDEMKKAGQTTGMKYRDFSKKCRSGEAAPDTAAAPPPPVAPPPATPTNTPPREPTTKAKASPGRQAMFARERACGAEWKAEKAAGKVPAGMHWPQYWHDCNKRKKAEGM